LKTIMSIIIILIFLTVNLPAETNENNNISEDIMNDQVKAQLKDVDPKWNWNGENFRVIPALDNFKKNAKSISSSLTVEDSAVVRAKKGQIEVYVYGNPVRTSLVKKMDCDNQAIKSARESADRVISKLKAEYPHAGIEIIKDQKIEIQKATIMVIPAADGASTSRFDPEWNTSKLLVMTDDKTLDTNKSRIETKPAENKLLKRGNDFQIEDFDNFVAEVGIGKFRPYMDCSRVARVKVIISFPLMSDMERTVKGMIVELKIAGRCSLAPVTVNIEKEKSRYKWEFVLYNIELTEVKSGIRNGFDLYYYQVTETKKERLERAKLEGINSLNEEKKEAVNSYWKADSITFTISEEEKKKAETELIKRLIEKGKRRAVLQAKAIGIPYSVVSPLLESDLSYEITNDYSGNLIIKGKLKMYY